MNDEKEMLFGDKKLSVPSMLKRSMKYLRPEIWSFVFAAILIIVNVILGLLLPLITGRITSNLTSDNINLTYIIGFVVGYISMAICNQGILYLESMTLQKAGQRIIYRVRMEVFEHIERMSIDQFNIMPVGSLVTRVCSYTNNMSDLFTNVLVSLIRNSLTIVGVYVAMAIICWQLALIMLAFIVLVFALSITFSTLISKQFRKERGIQSDLNTFLSENLSGMKIIQVFNQQVRKNKEFQEKNIKYKKVRYGVIAIFGVFRPLINFISYVSIAAVFYFGMYNISDPGLVVSFYLYSTMFFRPIEQIADSINGLQRALSSCERLYNLLDVEPKVLDKEGAIDISNFKGKIEFKNVWFSYLPNEWILKDVSFCINPKETVAFVGATGAGKTTILSLIVRNYEIQKGQILIDDIDIKDIKIESLRKAIGQMLQDVFLFSGSIKNNITLRDEKYSDEEIKEVCDYVNASWFINKLEKGLDSEVTERGENFSSGQRQLLSFARTVLHKPQILILDEATANIDTETEVLIQESLNKMKSIGTMLVVAHRLSTIQHADNIIVLSHGEVVEQGNHQELLKQKGYYYKLYQLQFENK